MVTLSPVGDQNVRVASLRPKHSHGSCLVIPRLKDAGIGLLAPQGDTDSST